MIQLKTPGADLFYTFDWSADLGAGVTLQTVDHTVPAPFTKVSEQTDASTGLSTVRVAGGNHGDLAVISALATLSTNEKIPGAFTLRCAEGT